MGSHLGFFSPRLTRHLPGDPPHRTKRTNARGRGHIRQTACEHQNHGEWKRNVRQFRA